MNTSRAEIWRGMVAVLLALSGFASACASAAVDADSDKLGGGEHLSYGDPECGHVDAMLDEPPSGAERVIPEGLVLADQIRPSVVELALDARDLVYLGAFAHAVYTMANDDPIVVSETEIDSLNKLAVLAASCVVRNTTGGNEALLAIADAATVTEIQAWRYLVSATITKPGVVSASINRSPWDDGAATPSSPIGARNLSLEDPWWGVLAETGNSSLRNDENNLFPVALQTMMITPTQDMWVSLRPEMTPE